MARRKALDSALIEAASQTGPVIIRLGKAILPAKQQSKSTTSPAKQPAATALGAALERAGLKIEHGPVSQAEPKVKPPKSAKPAPKLVQPSKPVAPIKPAPPSAKAKKLSKEKKNEKKERKEKRKQRAEERKRSEKLQRSLRIAEATQSDKRHAENRWQEREAEMRAFVVRIEMASFGELISEWKKHVADIDYIAKTGRKAERRDAYQELLTGIEKEWERRGTLRHSSDDYFDWPSTNVGIGKGGKAGEADWVKLGVLAYLGYRVGETSELTRSGREAILRRVFSMSLPPIESPEYMASWGKPATAARLKKMAHSLASFTRSAKRRTSADMSTAIAERESDLKMLFDQFYVKKFGFGWPSV